MFILLNFVEKQHRVPFYDAQRSKMKLHNKLLKSLCWIKYGECVFNRMCQRIFLCLHGSWSWKSRCKKNQWKELFFWNINPECIACIRCVKRVNFREKVRVKNGGVTWWCRIYGRFRIALALLYSDLIAFQGVASKRSSSDVLSKT